MPNPTHPTYADGYYAGMVHSMLIRLADQDTEAHAAQRPTICLRLPAEFYDPMLASWVPFDFNAFLFALEDLDDGEGLIQIRTLRITEGGEREIEVAGTEGYQGLPTNWRTASTNYPGV